jgi:hypothetical protein
LYIDEFYPQEDLHFQISLVFALRGKRGRERKGEREFMISSGEINLVPGAAVSQLSTVGSHCSVLQ